MLSSSISSAGSLRVKCCESASPATRASCPLARGGWQADSGLASNPKKRFDGGTDQAPDQGAEHAHGSRRMPHLPLLGLHSSSVQLLRSSGQVMTGPGLQKPSAQTSDVVHGLPSSHGAVFAMPHVPSVGLQTSSVHGFLSSGHSGGTPHLPV